MSRIMKFRHLPRRNRRQSDRRTPPHRVQAWIILLLVVFAGVTSTIGWWSANVSPRLHLSPDTILYRAIALELALTTICGLLIYRLVTRHILAPLKHQADHDDLTDLLRPGAFWERAEATIAQAALNGQPISFVFIDLDNFKQVNDAHGHATGDALLRVFGQILLQYARSDDVVGRLGGEEFGWLMKNADSEDARAATLRVLGLCASLTVNQVSGFGFSAGISSDTPSHDSAPRAWDLARYADAGLYEAKANGKAQVIVKSPKEPLQA